MNRFFRFLFAISLTACLYVFSVEAQTVSGGPYSIDRSNISSGGGSHLGGQFSVEGTSGQPSASAPSTGGAYTVAGGFWQPWLAPTAAGITLSGKVVTSRGFGIRDVVVVLWGSGLASTKKVRTNKLGNFRFDELPAGDFYMLTVEHRRIGFQQNSVAITANESLSDLLFTALR